MRLHKPALLGQLLVDKGLVTQEQLQQALAQQTKTSEPLGLILVRLGFVKEEQDVLSVVAAQINVKLIQLKNISVDPQVMNRLPAKAANHYKVFPIKFENGILTVATHNPFNVAVFDDLSVIAKTPIDLVLASEKEIQEAIREYYGLGAETIEKMMTDVEPEPAREIQAIDEAGAEASISQFLNQILIQAYKDHATDIHIEPFAEELRIRYRIDGVLYDAQVPENIRFFHDVLISRIKILSNLNIAEKRLPQDGRFKVRAGHEDLDLRIAILPSAFGESVVIRILNAVRLYSFEELGFMAKQRQYLDMLLKKPHGIIFMTGPTGSGKTTTLYTCLSALNKDGIKIITIEDPIEYQLRGVTQIQTHSQIGLTFAHILRSLLRCDPNIIMVGEVRDSETAQITIQVALTGHLVFSTLHTNDAASGITRLLDMGIEPYLIASSVECFIAQRLVRLLCPQCKVPGKITSAQGTVYEPLGCKHCRMTGYIGRQAICEFLMMTDEIRALVTARATAGEIRKKAMAAGMKTLQQHGWEKVLEGITSPAEVMRVSREDI